MSRAITGIVGGKAATWQEYRELFSTAMRPAKFSAREAGFQGPAGRGMPTCGECQHWYLNPQTRHTVCEVVRLPGEQDIRPTSTCRFQTTDGVRYPLLEIL